MALANLAASYSDSESGEDENDINNSKVVATSGTSNSAAEAGGTGNISDSDTELTTEGYVIKGSSIDNDVLSMKLCRSCLVIELTNILKFSGITV